MFTVIVWNNAGERREHPCDGIADALGYARCCRTLQNRTVKVAHNGDSVRHWSRTIGARRNHWATHSTAECSR